MPSLSDLVIDIEHRFTHHPPLTDLVAEAHDKARAIITEATKELCSVSLSVAPWSRELALAVTELEKADQWVHAHIARNQTAATPAPAPTPTPVPEVPTPAPVVEPAPVVAPVAPAPVATPDPTPAPATPTAPAPVAPAVDPQPAPVAPVTPPAPAPGA